MLNGVQLGMRELAYSASETGKNNFRISGMATLAPSVGSLTESHALASIATKFRSSRLTAARLVSERAELANPSNRPIKTRHAHRVVR